MASFAMNSMGQKFGVRVCCCRICTCINFGFAFSRIGLLKLLELGLSSVCETLLVSYGIPYAENIGQALNSFLTTTAFCWTTTAILLFCYCFTEKSYNLIRQSVFVSKKKIR